MAGGTGSFSDALSAVGAVGVVARSCAQKAEDGRRLPGEVVDAIAESGLWGAFVPRSLGGWGLIGQTEQFEITRAMAYEDSSTGWALFICGVGLGLFASRLPEAGRAELLAGGAVPLAGVFDPAGTAVRTEDGWRVNGRWSFASGISYAGWVSTNTIVVDASGVPVLGPGGAPEIRTMILRPDQVTVIDDWHVAGLRGTGSMSYTVEDVLVPDQRTCPFFGPSTVDDAEYRTPLFSLIGCGLVGVAVGIAERALDETIALLPGRLGPPTFRPESENPVTQSTLGRAAADIRAAADAARALYAQVSARAAAGEDLAGLSLADRVALRSRSTWVVGTVVGAVNSLFRLGGAKSIYEPGVLQRCWRDANILSQHLFVRPSNFEVLAKVELGIDAESPFI
ncbi:MAG: acyl-CoA dehydrogenase family protein [Acidimicrobiales bacterium]